MKLWRCTKCDNEVITSDNCKYVLCNSEHHIARKHMEVIKQGESLVQLLKEY